MKEILVGLYFANVLIIENKSINHILNFKNFALLRNMVKKIKMLK